MAWWPRTRPSRGPLLLWPAMPPQRSRRSTPPGAAARAVSIALSAAGASAARAAMVREMVGSEAATGATNPLIIDLDATLVTSHRQGERAPDVQAFTAQPLGVVSGGDHQLGDGVRPGAEHAHQLRGVVV